MIKLGSRVRRRNDNGMDTPGSVVRTNGIEFLVYWPQDDYFQLSQAEQLEEYESAFDLAAA